MKITISVIKADIGSVGGHIAPSAKLLETVRKHIAEQGKGLLMDSYVSCTGDDIAILMTHRLGEGNEKVHSSPGTPLSPGRQWQKHRASTARGRTC